MYKSPPYSTFAIGYLENILFEQQRSSFGDDYAIYVRKMLQWFLDDIFIKWRLSLGSPNDLLQLMNDLDPKISFTMESGRSLPFLDVSFFLTAANTMQTDIFDKETDSHNCVQFLKFSSSQDAY